MQAWAAPAIHAAIVQVVVSLHAEPPPCGSQPCPGNNQHPPKLSCSSALSGKVNISVSVTIKAESTLVHFLTGFPYPPGYQALVPIAPPQGGRFSTSLANAAFTTWHHQCSGRQTVFLVLYVEPSSRAGLCNQQQPFRPSAYGPPCCTICDC